MSSLTIAAFLALVVASGVAALVQPMAGLVTSAILVAAGIVCYVIGPAEARTAGVALALVATIQVIAATVPGRGIALAWRVGFAAAAVLPAALAVAGIDELRRPPLREATKQHYWSYVVGPPLGAALGIGYWNARHRPTEHASMAAVIGMAFIFVFAAAVEEICFRRVVHTALRVNGATVAAIGSTTAWAMSAAASNRLSVVAIIAVAGVVLAYFYERTGSLRLVIAIHAVASLTFLSLLVRARS